MDRCHGEMRLCFESKVERKKTREEIINNRSAKNLGQLLLGGKSSAFRGYLPLDFSLSSHP